MKAGNVILVGLGVWAVYEIYKTRSVSGALKDMKSEIVALRDKVTGMKSDMDKSTMPATKTPSSSASFGFVGQPAFTQVITPACEGQLQNFSNTDYYSVFRKKPTAFNGFNGWR